MNGMRDEPAGRLDEALARLPRQVEPARDLWPAIEGRLEPREGRSRGRGWQWPAAAAAAVLLVAVSSVITASLVRREQATMAQRSPAPTGAVLAPAAFGPGQALGPAYLAARGELARSLEARIARLPPDGRLQLERNLAELRRASEQINAALELSPGDPLLEELLLNVYQDELAVLASANEMAAPNGGPANDPTRMQL
jgi:hypothetical protein